MLTDIYIWSINDSISLYFSGNYKVFTQNVLKN
jgi:hypothetical protein